jgi:hypothetical protein
VPRVRGIGFDLGSQTPDVNIDEPTITEVVVTPHVIEQVLAAVNAPGVLSEFAQQAKLGLGEMQLFAGP